MLHQRLLPGVLLQQLPAGQLIVQILADEHVVDEVVFVPAAA